MVARREDLDKRSGGPNTSVRVWLKGSRMVSSFAPPQTPSSAAAASPHSERLKKSGGQEHAYFGVPVLVNIDQAPYDHFVVPPWTDPGDLAQSSLGVIGASCLRDQEIGRLHSLDLNNVRLRNFRLDTPKNLPA